MKSPLCPERQAGELDSRGIDFSLLSWLKTPGKLPILRSIHLATEQIVVLLG